MIDMKTMWINNKSRYQAQYTAKYDIHAVQIRQSIINFCFMQFKNIMFIYRPVQVCALPLRAKCSMSKKYLLRRLI